MLRPIPPIVIAAALILNAAPMSAEQPAKPSTSETSTDALRLAVDLSDSAARLTAIGLSSLAGSETLGFDIDSTWIGEEDDAVTRLKARDVELALLRLDEVGSEQLDGGADLRAVMQYWISDDAGVDQDASPGRLLVTDASMAPERVEALIDVIFEKRAVLQAARIDVARLTPDDALSGLPIEPHDGVRDYLDRDGSEPASASERSPEIAPEIFPEISKQPAADAPKATAAVIPVMRPADDQLQQSRRSFTLYFDTDDASLDRSGFNSVAEACRYAASLPNARFVISGHTDTVGSDDYNRGLSSQRALSVADAIRNDPRFREALSVIEFGEQRPAVDTGDEVPEPMNRRVEITVLEQR